MCEAVHSSGLLQPLVWHFLAWSVLHVHKSYPLHPPTRLAMSWGESWPSPATSPLMGRPPCKSQTQLLPLCSNNSNNIFLAQLVGRLGWEGGDGWEWTPGTKMLLPLRKHSPSSISGSQSPSLVLYESLIIP